MLWEHALGWLMLLALLVSVIAMEGAWFFDVFSTLCLFASIALSL
jgi:hypothetical protein